jgi:hypothetical protein
MSSPDYGPERVWVWAAMAVTVELGDSVPAIFRRWVWLGAGGPDVLTAVARAAANNFWALARHDRFMAMKASLSISG